MSSENTSTLLRVTEWTAINKITIIRLTQIQIFSNLEAYVCVSYDAMTTKAIFQMERKHIVKISRKPVSKCVAAFQLHCLPVRKRRKVNLNLVVLRWFCLLFSTNERIGVGVFHRELPFIYLLLHKSAPFSRNFVKDATRSHVLISFKLNKYFIIYITAK